MYKCIEIISFLILPLIPIFGTLYYNIAFSLILLIMLFPFLAKAKWLKATHDHTQQYYLFVAYNFIDRPQLTNSNIVNQIKYNIKATSNYSIL